MRTISAASLQKLSQKTGTEPMLILSVSWLEGQPNVLYSEKYLPDYGIEGRIISTGSFDDVTNISQNGTSQSFSVTLDDSDGVLKQYLDNVDFHRRPVSVYQWFTGLPLSDTFLLFYGLISSPIIWKEYDRTLSFTILSKTEGLEVGFVPEMGNFGGLPNNVLGKAWPTVFGFVNKSPTVLIDNIPSNPKQQKGSKGRAITKEATGIADPSIALQLDKLAGDMFTAGELAYAYFIGYLLASNTARARGEIGEFDFVNQGQGTFSQMAQQYQEEGNKMLALQQTLQLKQENLILVHSAQLAQQKKSIAIHNGDQLPQNTALNVDIGGAQHQGYFNTTYQTNADGTKTPFTTFHINKAVHPNASLYTDFQLPSNTATGQATTQPILNRDKFFFADAATYIGMPYGIPSGPNLVTGGNNTLPIRYVASCQTTCGVFAAFAYRTVDNVRALCVVPGNYYATFTVFLGSLPVTLLQLPKALSNYVDSEGNSEGWEDEIWINASATSPDAVNVIEYIIFNYTDMGIDTASFNLARTQVPYGLNFTLTSQQDSIKLLQDLAYQCNCMLYTKNNTFYIIYLGTEPAPIDTITEDDILNQSLEVTTTETEDIATVYVANWQPDYIPGDNYSVTFRYNLQLYQLITKTVNFFALNFASAVVSSATFWLIRESNIFKKVTFKTPIHKLNLEVNDYVLLNFNKPYIAKTPIVGRVESAIFDPSDYTITFTIWTPVLLGSNVKFDYSYPADLSETQVVQWPTQQAFQQNRVQHSTVTLPTDPNIPASLKQPITGDVGDVPPIQTPGLVQWGTLSNFTNPTPLKGQTVSAVDSASIQRLGRPQGVDKYQYDNGVINPVDIKPILGVIPAKVVSKQEDGSYTCTLYYTGIDGEGVNQKFIRRLSDAGSDLQPGTNIFVVRYVWALPDPDNPGQTLNNFDMYILESGGGPNIMPGRVEEKNEDGTYSCTVFLGDIEDDSTIETLENVTQMQIDPEDTIPQGTMVFIMKHVWNDPDTNESKVAYLMQVPVWLSETGSDTTEPISEDPIPTTDDTEEF